MLLRRSLRLSLSISTFFAILVASEPFDCTRPSPGHFNRDDCNAKVKQFIDSGQLTSNDTCLAHNKDGTLISSMEDPMLTITACKAVCGSRFGWYRDIGPRLASWTIPIFLLLSNMEVSPLDKRRYLMIIHLVADPIHSLSSLLWKLEAWSRCHHLATQIVGTTDQIWTRNVATVLGGFEDLVGFHNNPKDVYLHIKKLSIAGSNFNFFVSRTALQLADNRSDERLRTIFAVVLYIYQVISAFVAVIGGGQTSPPGGRIAIAIFETWIIPSILLSNAIGSFTSQRTCYDILEAFVVDVTGSTDAWLTLQDAAPSLKQYKDENEYIDSLAWSGGIYTYRPSHTLPFTSGKKDKSPILIFALAIQPILISALIASVILWETPPIGMNCRNILLLTLTSLIFFSTAFTHLTSRFTRGSSHWHIVLVKDAILALPSVLLLFLACAGLFNSCWCWSGPYSREIPGVPLNTYALFERYNRTLYPILVAGCLTVQIGGFLGMMGVGWRGWRLMRWSEGEKREAWRAVRRIEGI